jgi:hypothetical protein
MEKQEEVVGKPVVIGSTTIVPVTRSIHHCRGGKNGFVCTAMVVPVGVLVISGGKRRAFRTTGEEVSVEQVMGLLNDEQDLLTEDPEEE